MRRLLVLIYHMHNVSANNCALPHPMDEDTMVRVYKLL